MIRTLAVVAVALSAHAAAQCDPFWLPGVGHAGFDGAVTAATLWDPDGPGPAATRLVAGGEFTVVGDVVVHGLAAWDPATAAWSSLGLEPGTRLTAVAVDAAGRLHVAGWLHYGGAGPLFGVATRTASGWAAVGALNDYVEALLPLPNGDLVAAGTFAGAAVQRWDGTSWTPLPGLPATYPNRVTELAVLPNGDLVAGGLFRTIFGAPADFLARWNGTSWSAFPGGPTATVTTLAVMPNGDLIAGGWFTAATGGPADRIARWDGTSWSPLGSGLSGLPLSMHVQSSGDLLVGGEFTTAAGGPADRIARFDGTAWSSLGAGLPFPVRAIAELPGGDLLAGGDQLPGPDLQAAGFFDGAAWSPVVAGGGIGAPMTAVTVGADGAYYVSGEFAAIGAVAAELVARFDGTSWSPLGSGLGVAPIALEALPNGDIVAGFPYAASGLAANGVARWNGASWQTLGAGIGGEVAALLSRGDGTLVAGGSFWTAGSSWAPNLASWNGTAWSPLGTGPNGPVRALAEHPSGDLVVGGAFTGAGGVPCNRIARWDGATFSPLGAGLDWTVDAVLCLPGGDVVAGGRFQNAGGAPASYVARWDGASWSPLGGGLPYWVFDLALLPSGDVVASGPFAGQIAVFDGTSWTEPAGGVGWRINPEIRDLAVHPDGELAVVGQFSLAGGEVSVSFARLATPCPADATAIPTSCVGPAGPVTLTPDNLPWTGSTFSSTATGFLPGSLAVALLGLSSPGVPLTWVWPNTLPGCDQLASHEAILLTLPQNGASGFSFAIPNAVVFAGLPLFHQFLHFEVDAMGNLATLSSSNGLQLTIGAF